jgi:hypothetical protein
VKAIPRPSALRVNAWDGTRSPVGALPASTPWALLKAGDAKQFTLAPPGEVDERNWRDPAVGWGLVLPDDPALGAKEKAAAADAPEPLQRLVEAREAPVLRYQPADPGRLHRYYEDGSTEGLLIAAPQYGVAREKLPRYLLIAAPPTTIPWVAQYELSSRFYVGRLDLPEAGLKNYVDALLDDW